MELSNSNNYIVSLVNASNDAQGNLYEITFTGGVLDDIAESLKVRVDDFTPPTTSQEKYDVKFVTATIPRPKAFVGVTRNFTLTLRVDANYTVYKALLQQQAITFNPTNGYATNDIASLYNDNKLFDVKVDVIDEGISKDSSISTRTLFKFKGCWISNIEAIGYKVGSSDPATVSFTINFLKMKDLQTGIDE